MHLFVFILWCVYVWPCRLRGGLSSGAKNKGWAWGRFGLGQILHPASDMNDVRFVESAVKHLTERRQHCSDKGSKGLQPKGSQPVGWLGGWLLVGSGRCKGIDEVLGRLRRQLRRRLLPVAVASANNTLHWVRTKHFTLFSKLPNVALINSAPGAVWDPEIYGECEIGMHSLEQRQRIPKNSIPSQRNGEYFVQWTKRKWFSLHDFFPAFSLRFFFIIN